MSAPIASRGDGGLRVARAGGAGLAALLGALALWLPTPVHACSSHGTSAPVMDLRLLGDIDDDGRIDAFVGIEDDFLVPSEPTTCVAGIGLGTASRRLPPGAEITGAHVTIVDTVSGARSPLAAFGFAANGNATDGLASGSGPGGPADTNPIFADAAWFGFAAAVDPFVPPMLGPDEVFELAFDLELPASVLPLTIEVQFAAGEGDASGAPLFFGAHPPRYFTSADPVATLAPEPGPLALGGCGVGAAALLARRAARRAERMRRPSGRSRGCAGG